MLKLILMRHAKSSWSDKSLDDSSRPLSQRGRKAAPLVGRSLADLRMLPDHVACSPAKRTRETLQLALGAMGVKPTVEYTDELYAFGDGTPYLAAIRRQPSAAKTLMLVGHNPSTQSLAIRLCLGSVGETFEAMIRKFPTAGVAVISLPVDSWADVEDGDGSLEAFLTPRMLEEDD
jgi:phosphohistidine phosphatase